MEVNTRSPVPKPCAAINSPKTSEEGNRRQAGGWWTGKTQRLAHLRLLERCLWQRRARLKHYQTQKGKVIRRSHWQITGFKRGNENEALSKTRISTSGKSGETRELLLSFSWPGIYVHLKLHITKIKHQSSSTIPNPQNWAQRNNLYLQMNLSFNLLHFSYTNTTRLKTVDILIKTLTFFIYIYSIFIKNPSK